MKKQLISGLLWMAALLPAAWAQESDWREYVYRGDGVAFSVPSEPKEATETIQSGLGPAQMHNYTSESSTHLVYLASVVTYQKALDADTSVQQAKKGAADSLKAEILSERQVSVQQVPGIEFDLKSAEYHARMRYFATGNKLIGLLALAPLDTPLGSGADRFLRSLRLVGDSEVEPAHPSRSPSTGWQEYSYENDGIAFAAPITPVLRADTTQTDIGPEEIHKYSIDVDDNVAFMVSVTDFKRSDLDARDAVRRAKEGSIKAVSGTLVSERDVTLGDNSGVQFEVEASSFHTRARYFFVKGKLIGLMSMSPMGKSFSSDTNRFFESLRLLGGSQ